MSLYRSTQRLMQPRNEFRLISEDDVISSKVAFNNCVEHSVVLCDCPLSAIVVEVHNNGSHDHSPLSPA